MKLKANKASGLYKHKKAIPTTTQRAEYCVLDSKHAMETDKYPTTLKRIAKLATWHIT
jgi:hypothetical protein